MVLALKGPSLFAVCSGYTDLGSKLKSKVAFLALIILLAVKMSCCDCVDFF